MLSESCQLKRVQVPASQRIKQVRTESIRIGYSIRISFRMLNANMLMDPVRFESEIRYDSMEVQLL